MRSIQRAGLVALVALGIAGCRAEEVELRIDEKEFSRALAGEEGEARFKAEFQLLAELDDETKAMMDSVQEQIADYLAFDDFEVSSGDFGVTLLIEGTIPMVRLASIDEAKSRNDSAYVLAVLGNADGVKSLSKFPYKAVVLPTAAHQKLSERLIGVNMMLAPEEHHPIKFKLRMKAGPGIHILTGPVQVEGQKHLFYEQDIKDRATLIMKGGIYEDVAPQFYFRELD